MTSLHGVPRMPRGVALRAQTWACTERRLESEEIGQSSNAEKLLVCVHVCFLSFLQTHNASMLTSLPTTALNIATMVMQDNTHDKHA